MKSIIDNLKRKAAMLALSISSVEKNALSQKTEGLSLDGSITQRLNQGHICDSLINGEVTEEVLNLKWRTYKVLKASEGFKTEITGYDEDGLPITITGKRNNKKGLHKIKVDEFDNYRLEMVIDNTEIQMGSNQAFDNDNISLFDEVVQNLNDKGEILSVTHGEINSRDYFNTHKNETPINIERTVTPSFYLENFTKKLNVRIIDNETRLLEFYVSKYPDEYNRTSRLFISNLIKEMGKLIPSAMLDINSVEFVTYKSLGVSDFLEFKYDITSFDKIVEFNGYYVIKFIAKTNINGRDITEVHRVTSLDEKYEQKAKK